MEQLDTPEAKPPRAHAAASGGRLTLDFRNWPVWWRLSAVVVVAVILDGVLGGLRLSAAVDSTAQFGRVAQLAVLGQQVTGLAHAMEDERDLTVGFVAAGRPPGEMAAVQRGYAATDAMTKKVQSAAAGIGAAFPAGTRANVTAVLDRIMDLGGLRDAALRTQLPSLPLIMDYSASIDDLFSLNDQIAQASADSTLEGSVRTLGSLSRMVADASEQRALLYAALIEQRFEPGASQALIAAQAAQASDLTSFHAAASLTEQQRYDNTVTGPSVDLAQLMEQHVIEVGGPQLTGLGIGGAAAPGQWNSAMTGEIALMRRVEAQVADSVLAQSQALRQGPEQSALLTGVLTGTILLLVLLATLVVARSLVLPLRRLRTGALDIAMSSLPAMVRELGENTDASVRLDVEPIGVHSTDEIGQVARAFDQVHFEAVRLAGNEAILRRNVSEMFVSLSRRSQSLIERLGQMVQSAGQREQDPALRSAFATMEHLVIRMRRNSENLLVLAGYEAVRRWSGSAALEELVQAAVAEIEQHRRVELDIRPWILVASQAATDVVHLLAELIENATKFSPPDTRVRVRGDHATSGGVLIEVHDDGVGVSSGRLAEMNQRLDNPPTADVSVSRHMGLFAVSHLAARHGVRVRLRAGVPNGLTALVWLPEAITSEEDASRGRPPDEFAHLPGSVPGALSGADSGAAPEVADQGPRIGGYLPVGGRHRSASERMPSRVVTAARPGPEPGRTVPLPPPPAPRSPEAARARLGGFQRGTRRAEQRITRAGARADQERADH